MTIESIDAVSTNAFAVPVRQPGSVTLHSILESNRQLHKGQTAINVAELTDMERWLRNTSRPALGTSVLTPEQRKLARCLTLLTRARRLVERIEDAGHTV